jgi:hypothetical protein
MEGFTFGAEQSRYLHNSPADFRFADGLARTGYLQQTALETAVPAFARNSERLAQDRDGNWTSFGAGQPAILPGIGYDHREGFSNLCPNGLDPRLMSITGGTASDATGDFAGFSSARRVVGQGQSWHRNLEELSAVPVNGNTYGMSVLFAAGTSPEARITVQATGVGSSFLGGPIGSLTQTAASAGLFSDAAQLEIRPGLWLVTAKFTCAVSAVNWNLGFGPGTMTAGDDILHVAQQFADTPYPMPFGSGVTANERLEFPAGSLGMATDPAVTGVTAFWRGRILPTDASYRAALEFLIDGSNRLYFQRNGTNDRLEVVLQQAAGYTTPASSSSLASALSAGEVVLGVTIRPDGSVRAVAADSGFADLTGLSLPTGAATFVCIGSFKGWPSINGTTSRVVLIPEAVSDGEFVQLFERVKG